MAVIVGSVSEPSLDRRFDDEGGIASEGTRDFLTGFLRALHDLIGRWTPEWKAES